MSGSLIITKNRHLGGWVGKFERFMCDVRVRDSQHDGDDEEEQSV